MRWPKTGRWVETEDGRMRAPKVQMFREVTILRPVEPEPHKPWSAKPPMNGKRERERRRRQMAKAA